MILQVQDGQFAHPGHSPLFHDLNLALKPGEVLAVLGPNGVGKTTLLNCMSGLLQWTQGQSWLKGQALAQYSDKERWQRMGYVHQARAVVFEYSVLDMVLMGCSSRLGIFSKPGNKEKTQAMQLLQRLEIAHLAHQPCQRISGGELQLVYIARALIAQPKLLFLDEPESHLDFKKQLIILNIIQRLAQDEGITCVVNTHFPNHALRIADTVLVMGKGLPHQIGPADDILTPERIKTYFGVEACITEVATRDRQHRYICPLELANEHHQHRPLAEETTL